VTELYADNRISADRRVAEGDAPLLGFVVGMARSGTTWLGRRLTDHRDVVVIGETKYWGRLYVAPGPSGTYTSEQVQGIMERLREHFATDVDGLGTLSQVSATGISNVLSAAVDVCPSFPSPAELFSCVCRAIAEAENKRWIIEKTPHHINWVDRIATNLPHARFIILFRDPEEFMLSYKHQGDRMDSERQHFYDRLYHPVGCALVWRGYARSIRLATQRHPTRTLLVSNDELAVEPDVMVTRALNFLGVDRAGTGAGGEDALTSNTSFPAGERPRLDSQDLFWMRWLAGREIRRFGMRVPQTSFAPWSIALSVIQLPVWAIRVVAMMRRGHVTAGVWRYLWRWIRPGR
jgi:hypothetical protein